MNKVFLSVIVYSLPLVSVCVANSTFAQDFKPGDAIEYKVGGVVPEQWERGVVIRLLVGGKQYLIHEKPSPFFPQGPEVAYALTDLRAPQKAKDPKPDPRGMPGDPKSPITPKPSGEGPVTGTDRLSKDEVIAYVKQLFGPGDPFADGKRRDANILKIRDLIKSRGANFLPDDAFNKEMDKIGANLPMVGFALRDNFGKAPTLDDYYGSFLLRTSNRGTKSATKDGTKVVITTRDAQFEAGSLTINKDATFVWKISRNDPESKWVTGKWHEATDDEKQPTEGGPSIVLEKARQNEDYTVRACRVPDYEGWIDVGMGKGRIGISYGRRQ